MTFDKNHINHITWLLLFVITLASGLIPLSLFRLNVAVFSAPVVVFFILFAGIVVVARAAILDIPLIYPKALILCSIGLIISVFMPILLNRQAQPLILEMLFYIFVPIVISNIVSSIEFLSRSLLVLGGVLTLLSAVAIGRVLVGDLAYFRLGDIGSRNADVFMIEGVYFVLLSIILLSKNKFDRREKKVALVGVGILTIGVIYSLSRGGWISIAVGLFTFVVLSSNKLNIKQASQLGLAGATVIVASTIIFPSEIIGITSRALSIFSATGGSNDVRLRLLRASIGEIVSRPIIIGIGANNFALYFDIYNAVGTEMFHAHNTYINMWIEHGILGTISFVALTLAPFRDLVRLSLYDDYYSWFFIGLSATYATILFHLMFAAYYQSIYFWIIYGLVVAGIMRRKSSIYKKKSTTLTR